MPTSAATKSTVGKQGRGEFNDVPGVSSPLQSFGLGLSFIIRILALTYRDGRRAQERPARAALRAAAVVARAGDVAA